MESQKISDGERNLKQQLIQGKKCLSKEGDAQGKQMESDLAVFVDELKTIRDNNVPPLQPSQSEKFCSAFHQRILPKSIEIVSSFIHPNPKHSAITSSLIHLDKIVLFTWQLTNIQTLSKPPIPAPTLQQLHKLCIQTCNIYVGHPGWLRNVTVKAMLIAYFNLIKAGVFQADVTKNGSICCLIQAVLGDTTNCHMESSMGQKHVTAKTNTELELEWFVYILQICFEKSPFFIKQTFLQLTNNSMDPPSSACQQFLHFISLLLNKIISDRSSTQLVHPFPCPLPQIQQLYASSPNITLKLSQGDYVWLLTWTLVESKKGYIQQLKKIWNKSAQQYKKIYIEIVMTIIGIINCCNFLGGYNGELQQKTVKMVGEFALEFLELSYLIYEISHARKRNIELKELKINYIDNLLKILNKSEDELSNKLDSLNINQKNKQKQSYPEDTKNLFPLQQGQLVCILRLLSNLVHINPQFQKFFEQDLKYFRIVMSLTHEVQGQLTMKNWAIVFLRNVAERSQKLRTQLAKLQVDVKVDNGFIPGGDFM